MGFGRKRKSGRASRPGIEALEGRAVPATFHAATFAELQADITAVDNAPGPNTIVLQPHTYYMTSALKIQNASDLTILGATTGSGTSFFGGGLDRVVEIDGGTVTLDTLSISGGGNVAQGGAIDAQNANLTVANSTISGNWAKQSGGGIYAQGGTLNVESSLVSDNRVGGGADGSGGAIAASNAAVNIARSTIAGNAAFGSAMDPQAAAVEIGGGIYTQGGTLAISGSSIADNMAFAATSGPSAQSFGGGVGTSNTIVTVARSTIASNTLNSIAQGITSEGGALSTVGGSLTIFSSKFSSNEPNGIHEFYHPGATVVLKGSTVVDGQKFVGNYILGDKGFTPDR